MTTFDTYSFDIQYQDLDENRRLRLYALENILLNVAGRAADKLGFGMHVLFPRNLSWVLTHLSLEMKMLPTEGDTIRIDTWIENYIHMLSIRNYRIWLQPSTNNELNTENSKPIYIGQARTQWTVINLIDRTAQNLANDPMFEDKEYGETLAMERPAHLRPMQEYTAEKQHEVVYSDIDYNGHCNSCKYLEMILNTYPDVIKNFNSQSSLSLSPSSLYTNAINSKTLRLDIKYVRELHQGELATIKYLLSQQATPTTIQHEQTTPIITPSVQYEIRNSANEISCQALLRLLNS